MRIEELHLIDNSMHSLLELANYLHQKKDAFEMLTKFVRQLETSINKTSFTHSARVALLAETLGTAVNLSSNELYLLKRSAYLHDIGKIFLPVKLFQKKEELNAREWKMIRLHPELGASLIRQIPHLKPLLAGVLFHHERYNGSGYPFGLSEQQIPLISRIIGLVDCFEALIAPRPYHTPLTLQQALSTMEKQKNQGLWDPYLFEVFVEITTDSDYFVDKQPVDINLVKN
ncbi:HD-GYP domain-containing protein [Caldithrix abyssi]